jgi:hypothetical protein
MKSTTFHKNDYEFELLADNRQGDNFRVFLYIGSICVPDMIELSQDQVLPRIWDEMFAHFQYVMGQPQDYDRGDVA